MSKRTDLESAFHKAEAEHTAAAERTRVLANKRADAWRAMKAAQEQAETDTTEPTATAATEQEIE